MAKLAAKISLPPLKLHRNHFQALTQAIISQQLSDKAATAILKRFQALFPKTKFPAPAQVLKISQRRIRSAGLSGAKAEFLKHLAKAFLDKKISAAKLQKLAGEEIISQLTQIKGLGRWSAEMFLMFSLGRGTCLPLAIKACKTPLPNTISFAEKLTKKNCASWPSAGDPTAALPAATCGPA